VNYLGDAQPTLMHDIQVEMTPLPSAERADGVPRRGGQRFKANDE